MRYLDLILDDRPLGVWPLDETGGTVARGYGRLDPCNGVYGAGATPVAGPSAHVPRAVSTDGPNGYVTLPSFDAIGLELSPGHPQSWEILAKLDAEITSASSPIVVWGTTSVDTAPLTFGDVGTDLSGEIVSIRNNVSEPDGKVGFWSSPETFSIPAGWHHHVVTYGGVSPWVYYLDGAVQGTWQPHSAECLGFPDNITYQLGRDDVIVSAVAGMAFAAVYGRCLSNAEILRHVTAAFQGAKRRTARRLR